MKRNSNIRVGASAGVNVTNFLRLLSLSALSCLFIPSLVVAAEGAEQSRGILELNSAETVLTVGGRINLTGYWSSPAGSFSPGDAPVSSLGEDNELTTHLRNSRLWFKTRTPTPYGQMKTLIETDFGGTAGTEVSSNSHNLRLRHAIFQLGRLTVGQTWSTFQTYVSPDILTDVAYIQWTRQPMVRWSGVVKGLGYDIALEQPETTLTDSTGGQVLPSDDRVADLVARVHNSGEWGKFGAAMMLREMRQDHATLSDGTPLTSRDSEIAWGINISAMFSFASRDDLRLGLIHGNGVGRYLAQNAYNAGTIDNVGDIALQTSMGGYGAYRHHWSDELRTSVAYSMVQTDNDLNVVPASRNKDAYSYHINLLWTPVSSSQFGIEYAFLEREQEDGMTADVQRLYFEMRTDF